jgi:sugar phosphate isomerase/epimerase
MLALGAASAFVTFEPANSQAATDKAVLGGSPTAFSVRAKAAKLNNQQFDVVEHCHQLGLAGAESGQFSSAPEAVKAMRQKIDAYGMTVIVNIPLPKVDGDVAAFDTAVAAAKEAGVSGLHAAMTARRYEQFDSLAAFKANFAQCQHSVELAEPVLRKHRLRLAVENHKGWRAAEQAAWMKRVSSEWVGVCLDMGNNLSLCEMPDETFNALVPYAIFSHLKDMGLEDYPDGFLLSEVPFGEGVINLKERVAQLRRKDPGMLFCIEMITRDPLKIPIYTDKYWATFSDPSTEISGRDVAMVLDLVRKNPPKTPLPTPDHLPMVDRLKAEDEYNLACIKYARQNLDM